MASIQEILESMRPDFQKLNALISNAIETTRALVTDMRESSRELKENLNSFESLIKEMGSEEVDMENGIAKVELQSESGQATDTEFSNLVDSEEGSEKVSPLCLKSEPINIPQTNFQENGDFIQCAIIEEIASLKQSGTVKEYDRKFQELAGKIEGFPESELVICFIRGLKEEINPGVQPFLPSTMSQARGLAELREKSLEEVARRSKISDSRDTWVQRRKFKNHHLCVCQRKPHVICHFRTWDERTIKIWHPGDSPIFIRYVCIFKTALTGIWDPGGIILENLTASWGKKARKCGEATSTPTVRSFDKESEPLVGMGNTKENNGLKPWCNSKQQIQDSCSSKAVKYSRFEVADMGSRTRNDATRIKVYRLNDDGKWDDQGTGHVTVDYLELSEELGVFVIDEEDHETLLMHHISSVDIYWNQEDTIISWRDPEYSTELALSFQEPAGCSYIWDQIGSAQRNLNFNTLSNDSYHSVSSELRELSAVELSTLPLILKTVVESGIADQMRITELILHDQDFFRKLMEVFRVCEDLENVVGLHVIFKIVGGVILLNSPQIFEKICGDELIMDIIGSLEYDPDIPHVQHHRSFLKEHVVFKEALPIKDSVVLSKIHRTYRVGYLKDVILPRALDDATIANLNSIIHSNNAIVVSLLKDDNTFIRELFARLRSSTTYMESKKNLVLFLHEFCSLSKSLQMVQQHWLYRDLVNEGKFGIIGDVFQNQDKKLVLIGTDILILFLNQDPTFSRSYVTRQKGIPLLGLLVKGSQRETIIEIFYEKHLDQLIEVITSSCSPTSVSQSIRESTDSNGSTDMIPTKPEKLLNICELLCFCVLRHPYRIKCNFLLNDVIHKVLSLTHRREKYLVVAAVRFLRTLISRSDEHLMDHIARNNLLKPIFYCVLQKLVGSE